MSNVEQSTKSENNKKKILNIIDIILISGPIKFLIILFCIAIVYIILYALYQLYNFIKNFNIHQRVSIEDPTSFSKNPKNIVIEPILRVLFIISWSIINILGTFFIMLYLIYCAFRAIGLKFLLMGLEIFRDIERYGIVGLFDGIFDMFTSKKTIGNKVVDGTISVFDFLKTFMRETFGIIFPNYILDEDVFNATIELAKNSVNNNLCEEDIANLTRIADSKPLLTKININFVDKFEDKPKSQENIMKIENCIKENTRVIPEDAKTSERLNIIYDNEIKRQRCINKDAINNFKNTSSVISKSIENNTSNLTQAIDIKVNEFMKELEESLNK